MIDPNNRIQPQYTLRQDRLISNENPELVIGICGKNAKPI